ncbi:MAG: hypothetical protein UT48_C0029G0007 [Parcubacteria group bacterium GW2011_GWE2_39_37]|uniref:Integral membrane protein n=1 Tax=Candidatus Falkowbacteria bacterium GW2011_GWF2_39_8 TaxID=1618642 RepID=A0A0G0T7U4_9BACT|nr:MAG: hypothetical protein UT48_C0029G0007 [Parcubacteria group bacterium GW2011_GWE2_39_37]KKR33942.1 MAG: hypothetical protein UT64_C0001G0016 [Candidatus Falkowbacteria bacterium GW2011_GWF2_39_8]
MLMFLASPVLVGAATVDPFGSPDLKAQTGSSLGLGNKDPRAIAATVINTMMGFLGIIAVVLILIGGFKWMTAAGNEEKISEAKKLLAAAAIGLVIILASWGIANFVLTSIMNSTGAETSV